MSEFTNQVIVVTGASEGIGRALCVALAPQKPKLVLTARNAERLATLKEEVEALGAVALVIAGDITQESFCESLIAQAVATFGGIDVLVNNAGGTMWTIFEEIRDTTIFDRLMHLNYLSAVYCTYFALPHLKARRGRLVGVASVAGLTGVPTRTAYAASKHAMFGFFDSLRVELAGSGVTVTMIAPDYVVTEIHRRALGGDGQALGVSPLHEAKVMKADTCAQMMVRAMEKRQRLCITSRRGRLGRWFKLLLPGVIDAMAAKAIRDKQ